jgi:hypothetical protein
MKVWRSGAPGAVVQVRRYGGIDGVIERWRDGEMERWRELGRDRERENAGNEDVNKGYLARLGRLDKPCAPDARADLPDIQTVTTVPPGLPLFT